MKDHKKPVKNIKELGIKESIRITTERLCDLFEALNGLRPEIHDGEEPYHFLVRLTPIIADYGIFAQRAKRAAERADRLQTEVHDALSEARRAGAREQQAFNRIRVAKSALQQCLNALKD